MTIDDRLLKPPLVRLFADEILIDGAINALPLLFAYLKVCGPEFIAECKKSMVIHWLKRY